jgi:signal transduction histidine kinase/DNA-binding response OmpR family regulator
MILIVDDKAENIFSLRRTLELNDFEVDSASSGEEALKKILNTSYSLIILDVQMPGMDGFEVAEALSGFSKAKDIPIIFLSAVSTEKKFITKGYAAGAIDYVTKPVDPDIFMYKVKTLHKLHEQNRELREMKNSLMEEIESRKQTELALNRTLEELKSVMEAMPQVAFTMKPNREIEYVNEHWYLYSDSNSLPEFHENDICIKKWNEQMDNEDLIAEEVRIKHIPTGSYRYHLLRMIPIKQNGRLHKWVGTFTDIHSQKLANDILEAKVQERTEELLFKNKELETSNHELQQFASVASHDLKEPLRKIQIFSSVIKDRFLDNSDASKDNINRVIDAASRMSGLINDLLNYSRLSVEHLFKPTDLNLIISSIINDLELPIKEKNAKIICCNIPIIDTVEGQMRQVFQNLLSNSLKFARREAQPEIHIDAEKVSSLHFDSPADEHGEYCRIVFSDNGIGFEEVYLDKIFTIFQRLNPHEQYEGTGIGLAIVKKIIEKHQGIITAKSKLNNGASFIMVLPLKQEQAQKQLNYIYDGQQKSR